MSTSSYAYVGLGGTGSYNQSGGNLSTFELGVGYGGSGVFNQSGGTVSASGWGVRVGAGVNDSGTYNMSNGASLIASTLTLGYGATSSGSFHLTGGSITADNTVLGPGYAYFNQSGGTHTVSGTLTIQAHAGLYSKMYVLSGGRLSGNVSNAGVLRMFGGTVSGSIINSGSFEYYGGKVEGNINNAGTVTANTHFVLDQSFANTGVVDLSTNTFTVSSAAAGASLTQSGSAASFQTLVLRLGSIAGQTGSATISNGVLGVTSVRVGEEGTGVFAQSGGTTTAGLNMILGERESGMGTVNLSGGQVWAPEVLVGMIGSGTVNHSGGGLTASGLGMTVGVVGAGSYSLSNSATLLASEETIGSVGSGTFTQTGGTHTVSGTLTIGAMGLTEGTYNQSGGTLATANTVLGEGFARFNHSGGTHAVSGLLTIQGGGGQSYTLSGSARLVGNVSNAGTFEFNGGVFDGTFNNSGTVTGSGGLGITRVFTNSGSVTLGGTNALSVNASGTVGGTLVQAGGSLEAYRVSVGYSSGETGNVFLSGGVMTANYLEVGRSGVAFFTQSGGSNVATQQLTLGWGTTGNATYMLTGGTLISANTVLDRGISTFYQSGGTHAVSGLLDIRAGFNTYTLAGSGRLVGNVSNAGTFNFNGGSLDGTFLNSGTATVMATGTLYLRKAFTNSGSVDFNDATIRIGSASGASLVQTAGFMNGELFVVGDSNGYSGSVSLSGGTVNWGYGIVGDLGHGVLTIGGGAGTMDMGHLFIGFMAAGSGEVSLSGGTLNTSHTGLGPGSAVFNQSGGTHNASLLTIDSGSNKSYTFSGGRLTGSVSNRGNFNFNGGAFDGTFNNSGSVVATVNLTLNKAFTNTGSVNMGTNDLTISSAAAGAALVQTGGELTADLVSVAAAGQTGRVSLSGGAFTVNQARVGNAGAGLFLQSGGTVSASTLVALGYAATGNGAWEMTGSASLSSSDVMVGRYGIGELNQFSGSLSASSEIFVGYYSTGSGQYNLIGGSASADYLYVGRAGLGTASQSGGSLTLTAGLRIGYTALSNGTYAMSNGASLTTGHERVGVEGRGTFNQTGGSHSVSGTLTVGYQAAGSGVVNLSGGSLTTGNTVLGPGSASINHSGGTHTISGLLTIQGGVNKTYTLSGSGRLVGNVSNAGTFNFEGGVLEGTFDNSGTVILRNELIGRSFTNTGNVFVDEMSIGCASPGANFVQTAGSLTGWMLLVGAGVGQSGAASLSGGAVNLGVIVVGGRGSGSVTHSGGTTRLDWMLTLGEATSGAGVFNLSDGSLTTFDTLFGPGSATFNHSGGTHTVENLLIINAGANKSYNLAGSARLVGAVSNAATFNLQGGMIEGRFDNSGTMASPVSGNSTITGNVTNTGSISLAGRLAVQGAITGSGSILATGAGSLSAKCVRQSVVTLDSASTIQMLTKSQGGDTSVVNSLSISGGAVMDLADNALIVDYQGASAYASIRAAIVSACSPTSAAHWNGPGITSRVAAANSSLYGVGFGEASNVLLMEPGESAVWQGQTVDSSAVLARFTLLGDADLSGSVNFFDLTRLAAYYGGAGDWSWGDFNYDGQINFFDLTALAANYGGVVPAGAIPGAGFGSDLEAAFAQVPEPSVLWVLGGVLMLRRRRGRGEGGELA